ALAAALALVYERPLLASALAALCAAASPVAGLLLALAGATYWLSRQRWLPPGGVDAETGGRPRLTAASGLLALGLPATAVAVSLALLFPEGARSPTRQPRSRPRCSLSWPSSARSLERSAYCVSAHSCISVPASFSWRCRRRWAPTSSAMRSCSPDRCSCWAPRVTALATPRCSPQRCACGRCG